MKNLTTTLLGALAIAGSFAGNAYAQPAAPAPDFTLSGAVDVQSDYRFRGISQNSKQPAEQATLNLTGPDGFYVGTWDSKVNWGGNDPSVEVDLYGGKHFDLGGTDLNVEAYYYSYPDYKAALGGVGTASYYETIMQLTHSFGPLTLQVTGTNSPQWSFNNGTGWYLAGNAAWAVTDWLSVSGNIGHQWVGKAPSDYTYGDFGGTATWKSWALDVRYATTDIGKTNCTAFWMATTNACSGGFVATLTYNIADLLK